MTDSAGLDMESYCMMYAAKTAAEPKPKAIIKRVCDYADSRRDDRFRKFAAYTSAKFTRLLLARCLPDDPQA